MTLRLEQVEETFARYSGEDLEDGSPRSRLCVQLCEECRARGEQLRNRAGIRTEGQDLSALESWAAAEAFYQLILTDEAGAPESVSADGVRIDAGERSRKAKALAEEKWRDVSSFLGEGAFYFGRA